jgi:hypothetical protein
VLAAARLRETARLQVRLQNHGDDGVEHELDVGGVNGRGHVGEDRLLLVLAPVEHQPLHVVSARLHLVRPVVRLHVLLENLVVQLRGQEKGKRRASEQGEGDGIGRASS